MADKTLREYVLPDGCRCDHEEDYKKVCGWKDTPPLCAHRIAADALNEMGEIEKHALVTIKSLPNTGSTNT